MTVTQAVENLVRGAVRLPDEAMDRAWAWGAYDEEGLRSALLVAKALFEAHGRARRAMSRVGDDALERPALFWDGAMPLRFRLHRFEAHMRQHTIQVEKTLLAIGHPATDAERVVRLVHNALAGVEAATVEGIGDAERARVAQAVAARVPALA